MKMLFMYEDDEGLLNLNEELAVLPERVRRILFKELVRIAELDNEIRRQQYEEEGTRCPGCGREDC
jgi:hypothetical protein